MRRRTYADLHSGTDAGARIVAGVLTGSQDAATLGARRPPHHLLPGVASLPACSAVDQVEPPVVDGRAGGRVGPW
jgi:hypothetical protein